MYDTQTGRDIHVQISWSSPVESFLEKKKFSQENETLLSADAQLKTLTVGNCLQRPKIPMWVFYYRVEHPEKGKFIHCNTCSNTIVMGEWPS